MVLRSSHSLPGLSVQRDGQRQILRCLPEEVPVAMVFEGSSQGVMMATPQDIEDFAIGFALSEGYIRHPDEIEEFEIAEHCGGIEARFWLPEHRREALKARRRAMMKRSDTRR